jgi:hypothetical protein
VEQYQGYRSRELQGTFAKLRHLGPILNDVDDAGDLRMGDILEYCSLGVESIRGHPHELRLPYMAGFDIQTLFEAGINITRKFGKIL